MERIVLDEEGNIARFLESIIENEGQLIVLEEQYHDFYKYVLLPILSYFEVFDQSQEEIPTYDEIKIYGDIDDDQMIYVGFICVRNAATATLANPSLQDLLSN